MLAATGLSPQQRARRLGRITASNVAACLGHDPYKSPRQAWAEITGQVEYTEPSLAARIGLQLEPMLGDLYTQATGRELTREGIDAGGDESPVLATLDFVTKDNPRRAVECKSHGILTGHGLDGFGEPGTDELPERHLLQAVGQMIAAPDLVAVDFSVIVPKVGHAVYAVERDDEFCGTVAEECKRFFRDYVQARREPPADRRDLPALERRERSKKVAVISVDVFTAAIDAKRKLTQAEEVWEDAKAALLAELGDADAGLCAMLGTVAYPRVMGGTYVDSKRLKAEFPEVYAKVVRQNAPHRRLTLSEGGAK